MITCKSHDIVSHMDPVTINEIKTSLEQEREKIHAELKSFARVNPELKGDWNAQFPQFETEESGSHSSLDEEADEVEEYEMRLATEHVLESRLLEVTGALERIQAGNYGRCLKCGQEISLDRLKANQAAEYDLEHSPKNA